MENRTLSSLFFFGSKGLTELIPSLNPQGLQDKTKMMQQSLMREKECERIIALLLEQALLRCMCPIIA